MKGILTCSKATTVWNENKKRFKTASKRIDNESPIVTSDFILPRLKLQNQQQQLEWQMKANLELSIILNKVLRDEVSYCFKPQLSCLNASICRQRQIITIQKLLSAIQCFTTTFGMRKDCKRITES